MPPDSNPQTKTGAEEKTTAPVTKPHVMPCWTSAPWLHRLARHIGLCNGAIIAKHLQDEQFFA